MLHAKRDKSAAGARRRQLWQQRLAAARAAYADTLANMDRWEALYNGSRRLTDADGRPARDSSNVRNIAYELVESQVDSTLPLPRVEAIHAEDTELARSIEAVLRHQIQLRGLADLNDLQERTVPIQGGSFWLVEWDPKGGGHCTLGQLSVTPLHPRQVIPQPGVCDIEKMDYLFIQMAQTKQSIYKRYGVDVSACGEQIPDLRGEGETPREELVTQTIRISIPPGGVGMFSWVEDVTLGRPGGLPGPPPGGLHRLRRRGGTGHRTLPGLRRKAGDRPGGMAAGAGNPGRARPFCRAAAAAGGRVLCAGGGTASP